MFIRIMLEQHNLYFFHDGEHSVYVGKAFLDNDTLPVYKHSCLYDSKKTIYEYFKFKESLKILFPSDVYEVPFCYGTRKKMPP